MSIHETTVARTESSACTVVTSTVRREYDPRVMAESFTDAALRDVVHRNTAGMIYVWSPRMPLSVSGIAAARASARALGVTYTAVMADAGGARVPLHEVAAEDARPMESLEIVYRDGTVHYPAVILYQGGAVLEGVIPGYKSRDAYETLAGAKLATAKLAQANLAQGDLVPLAPDVPKLWVDHRARVSTRSSVTMLRDVGFFFKPVAGTSLITYTDDGRAYLFDLATRRESRIPGHVDPVPTPDGRFLTRPGLIVHPMPALVRGDTASIFVDRELPDEYQTASILREGGGTLRYRLVTGWQDNARFRDYDVVLATGKSPARFTPAGEPFVPCQSRVLSLPISAKSGREFGAFDVARKTNGIIEVRPDGTCVDKLDLGFSSGKLSFSYDGKSVAFSTSRVNTDTAGTLVKPSETFYKDALLLQRATGRIVSLTRNRPIGGMSFPEFLPDGGVMVLDQRVQGQQYGMMRIIDVR
ncbi:MAG: hypothetical protein V4617_06190 [Gemmatimonadota bacterium]